MWAIPDTLDALIPPSIQWDLDRFTPRNLCSEVDELSMDVPEVVINRLPQYVRALRQLLEDGSEIVSSQFLGQMLSFNLNLHVSKLEKIQNLLIEEKIVIPVFEWEENLLMRISLNGYNSENDIQRLFSTIKKIIKF